MRPAGSVMSRGTWRTGSTAGNATSNLDEFYAFTDTHGALVHETYSFWPCKKDCDVLDGTNCCHHSFFPVTATEWLRVKEGFEKLPRARQQEIRKAARKAYLAHGLGKFKKNYAPFFKTKGTLFAPCPLLDGLSCSVFADRPVTCRTFGYFVSDEQGQWCRVVGDTVRERGVKRLPHWSHVEARMKTLRGPVKPLVAWLVEDA